MAGAPDPRRTNRGFITQPIVAAPANMPLSAAFGHSIGGVIALVVAAIVVLILGQKADPAEEAGVRLFGAYFALFGLMFFWYGLKNGFAVLAARRRSRATERWQRDWTWTRETPATDARLLPQIVIVFIYAAIVVPFNVWWTAPWLFFKIAVGVMDLIGLAMLVELLRRVLQWVRFGRARVTWHSLPVVVGSRLEGFVQTARRVSDTPATLTLQAIREVGQKQTSSPDNATELWADTAHVRGREGRYDFSFAIPKDVGGTKLSAASPLYWKLTVAIPTPGPDFGCAFLAPVYGPRGTDEVAPDEEWDDSAARIEVRRRGALASAGRALTASMVIFGVLGATLGWLGGSLAYENWRIWNSPFRVQGVVIGQETRESEDSDGDSTIMYAAVVRYAVGDRTFKVTQQVTSGSPMYPTGATLPVIYDPSNPSSARIATVLDFFFLSGILVVFSFACIAVAAGSRAMRR